MTTEQIAIVRQALNILSQESGDLPPAWEFLCNHANENPNYCPCSADCPCRQTMCKNKPLLPPEIPEVHRVSPEMEQALANAVMKSGLEVADVVAREEIRKEIQRIIDSPKMRKKLRKAVKDAWKIDKVRVQLDSDAFLRDDQIT